MTTPERRARKRGLYDVERGSHLVGGHIDRWYYEADLPSAIDELVDAGTPLSARTWIDTLVPFLAGLWVRGPDRNKGMNNDGRIVEFQEVLATIAAADWEVLHYEPESLLTSDRGFAVGPMQAVPSLVVPLDPQTLLVLRPSIKTSIGLNANGRWVAPIGHSSAEQLDPLPVNRAISDASLNDVYGSSRALVQAAKPIAVVDPLIGGLPFLPMPVDLRAHFYDYFRIRAAVRAPAGEQEDAAERATWAQIGLATSSLIAVEVLRPERTRGGVFVDVDRITLTLEWGQIVRTLRMSAGELINGASMVTSIAKLESAPRLVEVGNEWKWSGSNMTSVPMINASTGQVFYANLDLLRRDIARSI